MPITTCHDMIFDDFVFKFIGVFLERRSTRRPLFRRLAFHLNEFPNDIFAVFFIIGTSKFFSHVDIKWSTCSAITTFASCIDGGAICTIWRLPNIVKASILKNVKLFGLCPFILYENSFYQIQFTVMNNTMFVQDKHNNRFASTFEIVPAFLKFIE